MSFTANGMGEGTRTLDEDVSVKLVLETSAVAAEPLPYKLVKEQ